MLKHIADDIGILMEHLPGHVYFYDCEGVIRACNLRQARALGYKSIEEAIGVCIYDIRPESECKCLKENNARIIKTKKPHRFEELTPNEEGIVCLFSSEKVPVLQDDKVIGILGISNQIDKEELALRKKETMLQDVIDMLPAHIYWKNKDGVFLGCNLKQAQSAGFSSKDEFIGKNDSDMPWAADSDKLRDSDQRVMRTGKLYTVEEPSTLIDGQERIFLSKKLPTYNANGEIDGILGVSIDITAEKAAEKLRIEKEVTDREAAHLRMIQDIIDMLPMHIYWKDKKGHYLGVNLQQARSAGFADKKDMLGKSDNDKGMPWAEYYDEIRKNDQSVMLNKQLQTIEEIPTLADGKEHIFLSKKLPIYNAKGEVNGIAGVSVDITKEKETERRIKEDLQKQLHSANLLAASIAHELRTPLMTIGNCAMAIKLHLPVKDITILDKIEAIKNEINKANECINMLLLNVRDIHLKELKHCNMKNCVDAAILRYPYSNVADMRLITFADDAFEQDEFAFKGDETLMVHVLFNLFKNAIYFIHKADKGKIVISTDQDQKYNYLSVEDNACGIDAADLSKIFDRFFTTTDIGSGIGLSFCKLAIEHFGGGISCESVKGEYTKFIIRLPKI